jgi:hypothetical protein
MYFGVVGIRQNSHAPQIGITEIAEIHTNRGDGGDIGIALLEKPLGVSASQSITGSMNITTDYVYIGLEILPQ